MPKQPIFRLLFFHAASFLALTTFAPYSLSAQTPFATQAELADKLADKPDSENPVTWELKTETPARPLKPGDTFTAQLTAQIAAGCHLYSLVQSPGGPRPTRITLPAEQSFKLGGAVESSQPQSAFDENFGLETSFYKNSATFTLLPAWSLNRLEKKTRQKNVRQKNKELHYPVFIFLSHIFLSGLFSIL